MGVPVQCNQFITSLCQISLYTIESIVSGEGGESVGGEKGRYYDDFVCVMIFRFSFPCSVPILFPPCFVG